MNRITKKEGNIFWEILIRQKYSIEIAVKELMDEKKDDEKSLSFRLFRESLAFQDPLKMKFGIKILKIFYNVVLPAEYKALPNMTTYQQIERYYSDLRADKTV